jgi:mono/diheme cytochrome c family protein
MSRRASIALVTALGLGCYHVGQLVHLVSARSDTGAPPLYADRCSSCHGDAGRGDGPAGRTLEPRPRNFTDRSWQESISDDRIRLVIRRGGRATGLSASMAPHPDLSDQQIDALVAYIRAVGKSTPARAARTDPPPR